MSRSRRNVASFCFLLFCTFFHSPCNGIIPLEPDSVIQPSSQTLAAVTVSVGGKSMVASLDATTRVFSLYDPTLNRFSLGPRLAVRRYPVTLTSIGSKILVVGPLADIGGYNDTVEIVDLQTGVVQFRRLSQIRSYTTAVSLGSKAYFAGGVTPQDVTSDVVDVYDASTGQMQSGLSLSLARRSSAAAAIGSKVLVGGGSTEVTEVATNVVDVFDGAQRTTWQLSVPRGRLTAVAVKPNLVLFAGGSTQTTAELVDIFDVDTGQRTVAKLSIPREQPGSASFGSLAFFAGDHGGGTSTSVDIFDAVSRKWSIADAVVGPRFPPVAISVHATFVLLPHNNQGRFDFLRACTSGQFADLNTMTCHACLAGSFTLTGGLESCLLCETGRFSFAKSSACQVCSAGSICPSSGLPAPISCPVGKYCAVSGMTDGLACPEGTFCAGGNVQPSPCPPGNFCPASGLELFSLCPAGKFCKSGTITPSACPKAHFCPPGSIAPINCTAGGYCPHENMELPIPCDPGSFCTAGTTLPTRCPESFYCVAGSSLPLRCSVGTSCANGTSSPTVCQPSFFCPGGASAQRCKKGFICPSSALENGIECPQGHFCPIEGMQAGFLCPAGSFCKAGASEPTRCPAHFLCPNEGMSDKGPACAVGEFCPAGSIKPTRCPAKFYCPLNNDVRLACPTGFFCKEGSAAPTVTPAGFYSLANASEPTPCARGTFAAQSKATRCSECQAGQFSYSNATACSPCSSGSFSTQPASPRCTACSPRTYAGSPNSQSCTPCSESLVCPIASVMPVPTAALQSRLDYSNPMIARVADEQTKVASLRELLAIIFAVVLGLFTLIAILAGVFGGGRVLAFLDALHRKSETAAWLTPVGGVLSIVAAICMMFLLAVSVAEYVQIRTITSTLSVENVRYLPHPSAQPFISRAVFVGCPREACNRSAIAVASSGFQADVEPSFSVEYTSMGCAIEWKCEGCSIQSNDPSLEMRLQHVSARAQAILVRISAPHFNPSEDYSLETLVVPSSPDSIFQGPPHTIVHAQLITSVLANVQPAHSTANPTGLVVEHNGVTRGSTVDSETFDSKSSTGVAFNFQAGSLAIVVTELPIMSPFALAAQIVALFSGTVTAFAALLWILDQLKIKCCFNEKDRRPTVSGLGDGDLPLEGLHARLRNSSAQSP